MPTPHCLKLQINPECLSFLKSYKRPLSERQEIFKAKVEEIYHQLSELKMQAPSEFSKANEAEIARGTFYALTRSLEEKFSSKRSIYLADLESCLKEEFNIEDEPTNFIIRCLVEPIGLPLSLPILAILMLTEHYSCSNESGELESTFKYVLKAEPCSSESVQNDKAIFFNMTLPIKEIAFDKIIRIGTARIHFTISPKKQVKLGPIDVILNFIDETKSAQYQSTLAKNFNGWLLHQNELEKIISTPSHITDLWLVPVLNLVGLIVTITLITLYLMPIMPLLFPPIALMIGLLLASFINIGCYISAKNSPEKIKRPIYLFNRTKSPSQSNLFGNMQTTSFFDPSNELNPSSSSSQSLKLPRTSR